MAEVNRIVGPGGAPETPKRKKGAESDAFQKMMKTDKVREVDPEEKRKRKQKQEAEEEAKASQVHAVEPSPIEKQHIAPPNRDRFRIHLSAGTPAGSARPTSPEERSPAVSSEEEEAIPPPEYPTDYPQTAPYFPYTADTANQKQETQSSSPSSEQKPETTQKRVPSTKGKKDLHTGQPPVPLPHLGSPQQAAPEKSTKAKKTVPHLTKPVAPKPSASQPSPLPSSPPKSPSPKKKESEEDEPLGQGIPLPQGAWEANTYASEKKANKVEEPTKTPFEEPVAPGVPPQLSPIFQPESTAPYLQLSPQLLEIFERMAGVMTVMHSSGITQTTLVLDAPQFKNSVFFGAEIVITEFSTAPKVFNVEFLVPPQAVKLVTDNTAELVAAFQSGRYNFKVNRIDTALLPVPVAKRRRVEKPKGRSST